MLKRFGRRIEKYLKSKLMRFKISNQEFSIISNNCWGTFVYKQFDLPYQSPFINALIYGPDYISLLEELTPELLKKITFIEKDDSKYKQDLIEAGYYELDYPIGLLDGKYEIHFLHYEEVEDARNKWLTRCERINFDKLIVKFSDSNRFDQKMAERFDALPFENKVCFTSKPYSFKSFVYIEHYKDQGAVVDEWKKGWKLYDVYKVINSLK